MPIFEDLYTTRLDIEINSNDSNSLYTTARRQAAVNAGMQEFADLTECCVRQSSITVSCNTTEYMLLSSGVLGGSTDYTRLAKQGLEYRVTSSLNQITTSLTGDDFPRRDLDWMNRYDPNWRMSTTPTTPTGYYIRDDGGNLFLGLNRPPNVGSSQRAKVVVPYVARPPQMTSSGDVPFTFNSTGRVDLTIYHQGLTHYAAYKLLPLIGDQDGAQRQFALFMGYVTRYLQTARPKGGTHIITARNYWQQARRGKGRDDAWYSPTVPPSQWS